MVILKLGIEIGQTTVAKYMVKERRHHRRAGERSFNNHAEGVAALCLSCRRYHSGFCSAC
jgi:hypothetical protein